MAKMSLLDQEDSYRWNIVLPSGEKLDSYLMLAGPSHPTRLAYEKKNWAKIARRRNRAGKLVADISEDADELVEESAGYLAACTLSWGNMEDDNGNSVPYTPDAARTYFVHPRRAWLRRKVSELLNDDALFMTGSSPTSSTTPSTSSDSIAR